ncbi:hypothetical protein [Endozoicomonas sp. 8E]|uniref:hypothetical protein n=1 Tax=Endozoicomonas sp. 8E TaxID=3035692 RepID=UPI0029394E3A|nr:hypothetical protein [Endozoicomonas sp. 8E]WOG25496.1 hypothetical protein P6910_12980 [Endozoicomonas sp. 8E]
MHTFKATGVLLLILVISVKAKSDPLDIYSHYGYEINPTLVYLVISYPFIHGLLEHLHALSDNFIFALMRLVYRSQSDVVDQRNVINMERRLATTLDRDRTVNYYKDRLYKNKWWAKKKL